MTDDRVERVARAITAAAKKHGMSLTAPLMDEWPVDVLARAAIAAAEPQWKPIETAPKDGTDVLVATENRMVRVAFFDTARGDVWSMWPGRERTYPVAWMPLPPPPGADNE